MNTQKFLGKTLLVLTVTSCTYSNNALEQALQSAGNNRPELEKVLEHYSLEPEKLKATHFLIENMPAHYSYKDSMSIQHYYDRALEILSQEQLTPEQQRDSLLHISKTQYADINKSSIPDNQIIGQVVEEDVGFFFVNVEACRTDLSLFDAFEQCFRIDQGTARRVDEDNALFHLGDSLFIDI